MTLGAYKYMSHIIKKFIKDNVDKLKQYYRNNKKEVHKQAIKLGIQGTRFIRIYWRIQLEHPMDEPYMIFIQAVQEFFVG